MSKWYPEVKKGSSTFRDDLFRILPKNLNDRLSEYIRQNGGSFDKVNRWSPFMHSLTDEEFTTLYQVRKQLESSNLEERDRDSDGIPISNNFSLEVYLEKFVRDHRTEEAEPIPPGIWHAKPEEDQA